LAVLKKSLQESIN